MAIGCRPRRVASGFRDWDVGDRAADLGKITMQLTAADLSPLVALIAGILILIMPRLLNFIVAIYLIIVGLVGLNGIYHFIR